MLAPPPTQHPPPHPLPFTKWGVANNDVNKLPPRIRIKSICSAATAATVDDLIKQLKWAPRQQQRHLPAGSETSVNVLWHATNLPAIAPQRFDSRKTSRMQKYLAAAASANVSRYTLYMCMANLLSIAEHEESVSE